MFTHGMVQLYFFHDLKGLFKSSNLAPLISSPKPQRFGHISILSFIISLSLEFFRNLRINFLVFFLEYQRSTQISKLSSIMSPSRNLRINFLVFFLKSQRSTQISKSNSIMSPRPQRSTNGLKIKLFPLNPRL